MTFRAEPRSHGSPLGLLPGLPLPVLVLGGDRKGEQQQERRGGREGRPAPHGRAVSVFLTVRFSMGFWYRAPGRTRST